MYKAYKFRWYQNDLKVRLSECENCAIEMIEI